MVHLVGFSSNNCITMRGINSVKLQCGVWNCEAANIMEKRAGLNQFIAYAGRKQRLTHTHTHTKISVHDYCLSTAKGEQQPKAHELQ